MVIDRDMHEATESVAEQSGKGLFIDPHVHGHTMLRIDPYFNAGYSIQT